MFRRSLADAMEFCVSHAPNGELLDGSHHLWYELETTLRGACLKETLCFLCAIC